MYQIAWQTNLNAPCKPPSTKEPSNWLALAEMHGVTWHTGFIHAANLQLKLLRCLLREARNLSVRATRLSGG